MYAIENLGYGGNRLGPANLGPMAGRCAGYCAEYSIPGYLNHLSDLGVVEAYGKYNPWVLSKQLIKEAKEIANWQTAQMLRRTGKSIQSQVNTSINTLVSTALPSTGLDIKQATIKVPTYTPSMQVTQVRTAVAAPQINRIIAAPAARPEWPKIYRGKQVYSQADIDKINADMASKAELDRRLSVMRQQEYVEQKASAAQADKEARAAYAQKQREEQQALIAQRMQAKLQETAWVPFAPSMPAEAFYYATRKSPSGSIQSIRGNR